MIKKGITIWMTGLSGSGKSTISNILLPELIKRNEKVEVLDGDVIRTNLSKGLGFSAEDRETNLKRIAFVCGMLSRNGVIAISAAISPYDKVRKDIRANDPNFIEVFINAPIEKCIERDPKGLYKKALAGEIKNFTGLDDPYEAPTDAEIEVHTNLETPEESAAIIISKLEELGYLQPADNNSYSEEEQEIIQRRLEALGYV